MASIDIIMTKPGYGTLVEAVALQTPMVYVRRYNFADEQPLVDYLHRYGRSVELSMNDFVQGQWRAALQKVFDLPPAIEPPSLSGAAEAATALAKLL
jgi:UDP-N-acetylglucosamine:LPS N-acetylglucosamine transferase